MRAGVRPTYGLYVLGLALGIALFLVWLTTCAHADPATHSLPDQTRQRQVWAGDMGPAALVAGCFPVTPAASLTLGAFACEGYTRDTTTGELLYTAQVAATVGPLNGGDGTYWVALHRDHATALAGWTRQPGTAYLWKLSASQPADPAGGQVTTQVVVAGGVITGVADAGIRLVLTQLAFTTDYATTATSQWVFWPGGSITVAANKLMTMGNTPTLRGVPRQIFFGSGTVRVGNQQPSSPHWWGAKGDGTTDDTAAFNFATQSTVAWVAGLKRAIVLESGLDYFLASTVYVRAGQTLTSYGPGQATIKGDNNAAVPIVYAGVGRIAGVDVSDGGTTGIPTSVTNLFFSQGAVTSACLKSSFSGVVFSKLFISNCGTGIEVVGGDIMLSDITFDQGLVGLSVHDVQNMVATNLVFFNQHYGIVFGSNVYDVQFVNTHVEYVSYVGVHLPGTATSLRNIRFDGFQFVQNVQYATLLGMVLANAADASEVTFSNGSFRNMYGYAVNIGNAGGRYSLRNCVFDGLETNPAYDQSTTAGGVVVEGAIVELQNVDFRNLATFALAISGTALTEVNWDGGKIETSIAGYLPIQLTNSNANSVLRLGNIRGPAKRLYTVQAVFPVIHTAPLTDWFFPAVACPGARLCWFLPYQHGTVYEITVQANPVASRFKQATYGLSKQDGYNGAVDTSYLDLTVIHRSAVTDVIPVLDVLAEFTTAGGGVTVTPYSTSGVIAVHVPDTYVEPRLTARQLGW